MGSITTLALLSVIASGIGPAELIDERFEYDPAHPAAGVWLGNASGEGDSASIGQLVIRQDQAGLWTVDAIVPVAQAVGEKAANVKVEAGRVSFDLGSWRFRGAVSEDRQRLVGTIEIGAGGVGAFELARTPRPKDLPEPLQFAGQISTPTRGGLEVSISLARTAGGNWVGAMDFPASELYGLPLYDITEHDGKLTAKVPIRRGGSLDVAFSENRDRLTGTFKQGFFEFAMDLTRDARLAHDPETLPAAALGKWAQGSWMIRRHVGERWVLAGGNVIDVRTGQLYEGVNVVIAGDLIESVSQRPAPDDLRVVEITGRYVIPGLFDLHAHVQPFDRNATPDSPAVAEILETLLNNGVTVIRALPLISEYGLAIGAHVSNGDMSGPSIVPASGIFELEPQRTSWGFGDPRTARAWVEKEAMLGTRWIKVYNAMDEPSLTAIVAEAHRRGMRVCGHTEGVAPREASVIGLDCVEHMVSIPLSCLGEGIEPPGGLGLAALTAWRWENADDGKLAELMGVFERNETAWVPTLVVTEKMIERGGHDGRRDLSEADAQRLRAAIRKSAAVAVSLHRRGGLVGLGTDFPIDGVEPGISVHRELEMLVELGGATPLEALQIGTISSARILDLGHLVGRIEPGMVANLVVLEGNPLEKISASRSIELVVHEGRVHRPRP